MSECTGATTWSKNDSHVWGSCGWTMAGMEVKVFRTDSGENTECPAASDLHAPSEEEQGEICFRGRHIMMGYANRQDATRKDMTEDGWLR